jgi:hypothetical protein
MLNKCGAAVEYEFAWKNEMQKTCPSDTLSITNLT